MIPFVLIQNRGLKSIHSFFKSLHIKWKDRLHLSLFPFLCFSQKCLPSKRSQCQYMTFFSKVTRHLCVISLSVESVWPAGSWSLTELIKVTEIRKQFSKSRWLELGTYVHGHLLFQHPYPENVKDNMKSEATHKKLNKYANPQHQNTNIGKIQYTYYMCSQYTLV